MKKSFTFLVLVLISTNVIFAQSFDWTSQPSGVTSTLNDIFFVDNQTGWAVGASGVILATTDAGQTWNTQTSGTTDEFRTVFFIDAITGWASSFSPNKLYKTTDGGSTWTDITPSNVIITAISDIAFGNALNGWMVADSIYKTIDGGITWTGQTIDTDRSQISLNAVTAATDSTAYVAGRSKRTIGSSVYADVFSTALSPTSGVDFMASAASLISTTDLSMRSIDFATPNIIFAGGTEGVIYKMEWQGQNNFGPWVVNLDLDPVGGSQIISSISFPTAARGMFLTSNAGNLVYHTADTGSTWNMTPDTIAGFSAYSLHAPDANNAWIVGSNGMIYKGIPSSAGMNEDFLTGIKIYPNPTEDYLIFDFGLNELNGFSYKIVDFAGKALGSGVLNAENKKVIDVSNLQPGIYFLMIENTSRKIKALKFNKL